MGARDGKGLITAMGQCTWIVASRERRLRVERRGRPTLSWRAVRRRHAVEHQARGVLKDAALHGREEYPHQT